MGDVAFVAPFLPGKVEDHRRFCEELVGSRREEYEASRERLGIKRELPGTRRLPQEPCPLSTSRPTIPTRQCRVWAPRPTRLTNGFGRAFWIFTASTSPTRRDHYPSRSSSTAPNQSASLTKSPTKRGRARVAVPAKSNSPQKAEEGESALAADASSRKPLPAGRGVVRRPAPRTATHSTPAPHGRD
jgi:hypothetical protein